MSKNYQTSRRPAGTGRVTAKKTKASKAAPVPPATEVDPGLPGWALPSSAQVAMVDLAETARGRACSPWLSAPGCRCWRGAIGTIGYVVPWR